MQPRGTAVRALYAAALFAISIVGGAIGTMLMRPPAERGPVTTAPEAELTRIVLVHQRGVSERTAVPVADGGDAGAPGGEAPPVVYEPIRDAELQAERKAELEQRFASEPRDPRWANAAAASLENDLPRFARSDTMRVVDIQCRTTICGATLEFADVGSARRETRHLLAGSFDLNCGRHLMTPLPPPDAVGPYQSMMYFDCAPEHNLSGRASLENER